MRFTVVTGIGGAAWVQAAAKVAAQLGLDLAVRLIGPRRRYLDHTGDLVRARAGSDAVCVLVRPDQHVGWRSDGMVGAPAATLRRVLTRPLAR